MTRSRLFSLQARRAGVQAATLARDRQNFRDQAERNRKMQGRIDLLLDTLAAQTGPATVADLRASAGLAASLQAERTRQQAQESQARSAEAGLLSQLLSTLHQQEHIAGIAARLHQQERQEQQDRQESAAPPAKRSF
ncbi:MAG: hypothetical protein ACXIUW_18455 [Roseinatronobacter sp.]